MMRKQREEPTHQVVQFIGFSEIEVNHFVTLAEEFGLAIVAREVRKEGMRQMGRRDDAEEFLAALGAKTISGVLLTADADLLWAFDEWERDVRHIDRWLNFHDGRRLRPKEFAELLWLQRRALGWHWFWSRMHPDPEERQRYAEKAAALEAEMEALLRRGRRPWLTYQRPTPPTQEN
jgi:hypothetical protein